MAFGLTPTGFNRKTLQNILDEMATEQKARIDPRLNTEPEEPIGQLNGIIGSKLSELWEALEAVNAGRFPDSSSGFQLDQVSSITGTIRAGATKGTVTLDCTTTVPTTIPAGSIAQVLGDDTNRWVTLADEVFTFPGTQAVESEAEVAGNVIANTATITVIVTPVVGWSAVSNPAPASPGTEIDTDAQLRVRREDELSRAGSATVNAIRSDLLDVEDVISVNVFHNPTNSVDTDGLPPHSVEALVRGGTDQAVADALFDTVAAGIETFGSTTVVVVDTQGFSHNISFSRPVEIDMLIEVDIIIDTSQYPAGGDALIQNDVAFFINALPNGNDVFRSKLSVPVCNAASGIINITEVRIGSVAPAISPVNADYTILTRQIAIMTLSSQVTVATTPGSA